MNHSPNLQNLKPWKKGVSGNPKGRHRKIYTILKENGYSKDDIRTAFGELLFYNSNELDRIAERDDLPAIVLIVAKAIKRALRNGDYKFIKDIMEQSFGRGPIDLESSEESKPRKIEVIKTT
jgi:hypothetical protein